MMIKKIIFLYLIATPVFFYSMENKNPEEIYAMFFADNKAENKEKSLEEKEIIYNSFYQGNNNVLTKEGLALLASPTNSFKDIAPLIGEYLINTHSPLVHTFINNQQEAAKTFDEKHYQSLGFLHGAYGKFNVKKSYLLCNIIKKNQRIPSVIFLYFNQNTITYIKGLEGKEISISACSPDGELIAAYAGDNLYFIDSGTQTVIDHLQFNHLTLMSHSFIVWSPDSSLVALRISDQIQIINMNKKTHISSKEFMHDFFSSKRQPIELQWINNTDLILFFSNHDALLWNTKNNELTNVLYDPEAKLKMLLTISFNPHNKQLAIIDTINTLYLYQLKNNTLYLIDNYPLEFKNVIKKLYWHPKKDLLLINEYSPLKNEEIIVIMDTKTLLPVCTFPLHHNPTTRYGIFAWDENRLGFYTFTNVITYYPIEKKESIRKKLLAKKPFFQTLFLYFLEKHLHNTTSNNALSFTVKETHIIEKINHKLGYENNELIDLLKN